LYAFNRDDYLQEKYKYRNPPQVQKFKEQTLTQIATPNGIMKRA